MIFCLCLRATSVSALISEGLSPGIAELWTLLAFTRLRSVRALADYDAPDKTLDLEPETLDPIQARVLLRGQVFGSSRLETVGPCIRFRPQWLLVSLQKVKLQAKKTSD